LNVTSQPGYGINIQQSKFDDGGYDYALRAFIWELGSFKINDFARFVFNPDGIRYIENVGVVPNGNDNFDFVGGSGLGDISNGISSSALDSFASGRRVIINVTGDIYNPQDMFVRNNFDDYERERSFLIDSFVETPVAAVRLLALAPSIYRGFYDRGVVSYFQDGYRIYYGTSGNDADLDISLESYLHQEYQPGFSKGNIIVGGGGNDAITGALLSENILLGGQGNDELKGGFRTDTLNGGSGVDKLYGGNGADIFCGNNGDIITDLEQADLGVFLGNLLLRGGNRAEGAPKGEYRGASGEVYRLSGSTLKISYRSTELTILQFNNEDARIKLTDDEDRPDPDAGERNRDPLVIDLDGDRQVVLNSGRRSVYFDMNSDGFAELSAWVRPTDALLDKRWFDKFYRRQIKDAVNDNVYLWQRVV
jgi:Ca2+-binding RTX toxin-like protein